MKQKLSKFFAVRSRISSRADLLIGASGVVSALAIWCVLTMGGFVPAFFLPKPAGLIEGLVYFHHRHWLFPAMARSSLRVTMALLLVVGIGVPIGVLMGAFAPVDAFLRKIVNGAKSVPTTGIIGLIVLWFSIEERAKIVFLFLGAIFYMIILVKNAVGSVREEYIRVGLDLGANRRQLIARVLLPGALPQIWDAIAVCNGIMWTYIVLAEFINSSEQQLGLGYLLQMGTRLNSTAQVFGTLLVVAIISSLTDFLLHAVRRQYLDW